MIPTNSSSETLNNGAYTYVFCSKKLSLKIDIYKVQNTKGE